MEWEGSVASDVTGMGGKNKLFWWLPGSSRSSFWKQDIAFVNEGVVQVMENELINYVMRSGLFDCVMRTGLFDCVMRT